VVGTTIRATADLEVVPGTLDRLVLDPTSGSIAAGASQAYTATGFDAHGNRLGDLTAKTAFSISPNGYCSGASCTATTIGRHTVTGTVNGTTISATANLQLVPTPLVHLVLDPASGSIGTGASQAYTATGFDAAGNRLGDLTAKTAFSISPDGSCAGASCTATRIGSHTVTGTVGQGGGRRSISGTADLQLVATRLVHLKLDPTGGSIGTGASQAYTATGFDAAGNGLGNFTAKTAFTIHPNGSCTGASCTATKTGPHTITGTVNGTTISATADLAFAGLPGPLPLPWWLFAVGGAFLVAARTVAARLQRGRRHRGGVPQDVRAEPHPNPARVTVNQDPQSAPTIRVRLEPHPDRGTQTLKEVAR
jgi:hypothetical protein